MTLTRRHLAVFLVLIVSTILTIAEASAQFGGIGNVFGGSRAGRSGSRGGTDTQGNNQGGNRNERSISAPDANSYEQIEYRLSLLQDDLRLTSDQGNAWQAFAGKTRTYAGDLARERARGMRMGSAGATQALGLQHLGQAVDAARNRLTALEEVEASTRSLYQVLTSEQRTLADMRIPTIIAPRPVAPTGGGAGDNLPDLGSGSARPR